MRIGESFSGVLAKRRAGAELRLQPYSYVHFCLFSALAFAEQLQLGCRGGLKPIARCTTAEQQLRVASASSYSCFYLFCVYFRGWPSLIVVGVASARRGERG